MTDTSCPAPAKRTAMYPPIAPAPTTQIFIGEGDYAGFFAVVDVTTTPEDRRLELHGYIIEGEPPPFCRRSMISAEL